MLQYTLSNLSKTGFFLGGIGSYKLQKNMIPFLFCSRNNFYVVDVFEFLNHTRKLLFFYQNLFLTHSNILFVLQSSVLKNKINLKLENFFNSFAIVKKLNKFSSNLNLTSYSDTFVKYTYNKNFVNFLSNDLFKFIKKFNKFKGKKFSKFFFNSNKKLLSKHILIYYSFFFNSDVSSFKIYFREFYNFYSIYYKYQLYYRQFRYSCLFSFDLFFKNLLIKLNRFEINKFSTKFDNFIYNKLKFLRISFFFKSFLFSLSLFTINYFSLKNYTRKDYLFNYTRIYFNKLTNSYKFKINKIKNINVFNQKGILSKKKINYIIKLMRRFLFFIYRFKKFFYKRLLRLKKWLIFFSKFPNKSFKFKLRYKKLVSSYVFYLNLNNQLFLIKEPSLSNNYLKTQGTLSLLNNYIDVNYIKNNIFFWRGNWLNGGLTNFYGLKRNLKKNFEDFSLLKKIPDFIMLLSNDYSNNFINEVFFLDIGFIGISNLNMDPYFFQYYVPSNSSNKDLLYFYVLLVLESFLRGYIKEINLVA